jgi:hypothetical protein
MQQHGIGHYAILVTNSGARAEIEDPLMQETDNAPATRQPIGERAVTMRAVCIYRENLAVAGVENRNPSSAHLKRPPFAFWYLRKRTDCLFEDHVKCMELRSTAQCKNL